MQNLKYYIEGDLLYADMLKAIDKATMSINIESYIFANDEVGNNFIQLLLKKHTQGVSIKILIDSVGSSRFKNFKFFKILSKYGIQLKWFNPWSWREPLKFNRRNHRKLMIIDQKICFLGGFNLHKDSSKKYYGKERWKDSHISFEGELTQQLSQQFSLIWKGKPKNLHSIKSLDGLTNVLPNSSRKCRKLLRCKFLSAINNSKKSIWITTPYFVPDSHILKSLVKRAQQGVKISLLIPKYSNHALLKYAAYWYYQKLIKAGIKIYEFSNRMLHSKTLIVDNDLAIIGSANMDYRSFFINHEIMLFSQQEDLLSYLEEDFDVNITLSEQVSLKQASSRSTFSILTTFVAYLMRRWL